MNISAVAMSAKTPWEKAYVVGLGATGFSCACYLERLGVQVSVFDDREQPPFAERLWNEKPSIKSAPSNYAVIGRYILPREIFSILKNQKANQGGEIHITDAIRKLIQGKEKFIGHIFSGRYLDCGTMRGYIKSSLKMSKI